MLLKLLDVDYYIRGLKPVTSTVTLTRDEKFHESGLFSEEIFGRERSPERRTSYSYINLNTYVIHPTALGMLYRLDRRIKKFLSAEELFSIDESGNLIEDENGVTGISEFMKLFPKIKFSPSDVSKKFVDVLQTSYNNNVLFINKIPVIPPSFRDVTRDPKSGEYKLDPLNDYYLAILKRSFSIKSSGPPGPLLDILTYGMQEAVANLDEFIKSKLSHKFGLIRSQLLGKRVEFSARAVIANGPSLKINEIGIPFRMAITLFEPFIIHILLYTNKFDRKILEDSVRKFTKQELSVESIKNVIKFISTKDVIPKDIEKIFYDATEEVMKGRLVLAKRDPVLIPESVRSFHPVLIGGNVIRINNMQVAGFNADFDGDQMAVFHPLSDKAQEDARKLLRVATGENSTSISFGLNKESFLGLFLLTKDYHSKATPKEITDKDLDSIKDPAIPVLYKKRITTAGKVIFNNCLPEGFRFVDILVGKKVASSLISEILNKYGEDVAKECTFKLQTVAYKFATLIGSSLTLDVFDVPESILKLKENLDKVSPEEGAELIQKMRKMMIEHLKDTGLYDLCESGSTKGWDQPTQILITKGIISDVEGNILKPIKGSFGEGLTPSEHFKASLGARKGIVDRVINTADTGYTSRQLAYLLNSVELDLLLKDCKTKRTISLRLTDDIIKRLTGRYIIENGKVTEFIPSKFKSGDTIQLRSPIYCTSPKICHTCYGKLLERHKTPYVGVLASQIIGERGTQLIMKCSTGLVHYNNNLIPFVDLFEMGKNYRKEGELETVELNDYISGRNKNVLASTIQKHPSDEKMLFITTQSGALLICQSNHPLFVKRDPIHHKYDNKYCRLIGDNSYIEYMSTRKPFKTSNDELKIIEADKLKKHDTIWIDNSIALNDNSIIPELNGYISGIYCAEGCKIWSDRKTKGNLISQHTDGPIKDRICSESYEFIKSTKCNQGIFLWDNDQRINNIILGNYAWEKRLRYDFINFDKKWLCDFLAGLIDGDGSVFTNSSTCCRIYTTSYYLVQQLYAICMKLGLKFNVCKSQYSKKHKRIRLSFNCDIRFYEDSPKINSEKIKRNGEIVPIKIRKEKVIRGFDKITTIKEIETWDYPVYDIKTESGEFMLGCIQTHNSFHCTKKEQLLYIILNNEKEVISIGKLWDKLFNNNSIIVDNKEELDVTNLYVWDFDKFTKVDKLIRHKKDETSKIVMVRSNNSDFIISQDNHPHMLAKNTAICPNCDTPYTKRKNNKSIWECPVCKKHPHAVHHTSNEIFVEVEPREIIKSKYFSKNSFPIWQNGNKLPIINPYLLGLYLTEGSLNVYNDKIRGWSIAQRSGIIHDTIKEILSEYGYKSTSENKDMIIYNSKFARELFKLYGRYSWEKSLSSDFIYYSDETLSKILCGIIDGDGSVITTDDREFISIEITSLELTQQIHHILQKFGIEHKITLASIKKLTRHQGYTTRIIPLDRHAEIFQYSLKCKKLEYLFSEYKNNFDNLVTYTKEALFDEDEYLYDIQTESSTFTSNGFWTHNSGGSIKVKIRDVLQEFCENDPHLMRSDVNKIFKQVKDKIIVEKPGILTLSLREYDLGNDLVIDEEDGKIHLKSLLGLYETVDGKYNISIILDAPVIAQIKEEYIHEKKERIILSYDKDDEIFEIPIEKEELKELVLYTRRLIGGGVIFRDTEHLLMKLIRVYGGDISNMDLVHLEILISQCLRDKERPILPARLGRHPEDPSMFNLKKNVFTTSFLQGLSFENIGEAIRAGLTSEYELEPSVLEKVLLGTLIEEEKRKR